MANAKKSRTKYISRGGGKNVNRTTLNTIRRALRDAPLPDLKALFQREKHRQGVINGRSSNKDLKARYEEEDTVYNYGLRLFDQYRDAGVPWSACIQAIKTDWLPSFHTKWGRKLKEIKEQKEKSKKL